MSKQKTLFNYFTKSPCQALKSEKLNGKDTSQKLGNMRENNTPINDKKIKMVESNSSSNKKMKPTCRKRIIEPEDDSDKSDVSPKRKKPKEIVFDSEDSGEEYIPGKSEPSSSEELEENDSEVESSPEDKVIPLWKQKKIEKSKKCSRSIKKSFSISGKTNICSTDAKLSNFMTSNKAGDQSSELPSGEEGGNWSFLKYGFLQPDKIRDAKRRPQSDPSYDSKTLYVPDDFLRAQTPAMHQWWILKAKHFDCILFFKVGKFYEFYHMDAVIGVKELSLTFMKGDYAHCGFPEISYARFASTLVDKGYKVARVEQTETPEMMTERCKNICKPSKFDRVVEREICQVTTKGTRINSGWESKEAESKYLLAVCEKEENFNIPVYGVSFIDTTIGTFFVGQFVDDRHSSRLRTLIAKYPPSQVLLERNHVSKQTKLVLNTSLISCVKDYLISENEFWTASTTLIKLAEGKYFDDDLLPKTLREFTGEGKSQRLVVTEENELGICALGAIVWFLKRCLIDHQLLSMGLFKIYVPIDIETPINIGNTEANIITRHMILDAVTLKNLNILEDYQGNVEGTLLQKLDHCCTHFGKRLLRQWICNPLTTVKSIETRQKAVCMLRENPDVMREARALLAKVPDLERLLSRVHAQSTSGLPISHPENRAILFEEKTYSKRKIIEFISILNGFQKLQEVAVLVQASKIGDKSETLASCTHFPKGKVPGNFPDLNDHLNFFKNAFDHEEAEKEGRIMPRDGVDSEYDIAIEELSRVEAELKNYLKKQCDYFGCKITYVGTDKRRFQLEVPDLVCHKAGSGYELQGQRKGFKRYSTLETKELLEQQQAAEDVRITVLQNLRKRIFSRFYERNDVWIAAVHCAGILDVLLSLAEYAFSIEGALSIPVFKNLQNEKPFVEIKNGKYPSFSGEDNFIPNDSVIGKTSNVIVLTGPNMGGKTTLMRQVGLLIILAQIGSLVPAESMELTVVDRIFTRIGANDDIIAGESTFYLELCETSAILGHATKHSLVLIDELGRGTSTYDGTAIAAAVLTQLCKMECRTIFSTHYHSLVEDFKDNLEVTLAHMACMVETEEEAEDSTQETVTFLYKLVPGMCPKSYGFNAARLAGVPAHITKLGNTRAKQLELETNNRKLFRNVFSSNNIHEVLLCL